jgi:hypothetical protein
MPKRGRRRLLTKVPLDDEGEKIEAQIAAATDGSPAALECPFARAPGETPNRRAILCWEDFASDPLSLSSRQLTNLLLELAALDPYDPRPLMA